MSNKSEAKKAELKDQTPAGLIAGYGYNKFPNRSKRRHLAKRRGVFHTPGLWRHLNRDNENVQTVRRADG